MDPETKGHAVAGLVLAAGAGSRLAPLTASVPKPLVRIGQRSLLDRAIDKLRGVGASEIFVSAHHRSDKIVEAVDGAKDVIVLHEKQLTGPAGVLPSLAGHLQAFDLLLVISGDLLFEDDLSELVAQAITAPPSVGLVMGCTSVEDTKRFGTVEVGLEGLVRKTPATRASGRVVPGIINAGVYCFRTAAITRLNQVPMMDYISDVLPQLDASGWMTTAYRVRGAWSDLGTPDALRDALLDVGRWGGRPDGGYRDATVYVGEHSHIDASATFIGTVALGEGARIGARAVLRDCVVLPGAVVAADEVIIGGIVGRQAHA